jgi:membrane-bound lytic murein transglycosylase MltF
LLILGNKKGVNMFKYFIIALLFVSLNSTNVLAQNQKKIASIQHNFLKWTGDLDEMTKRRVIRVLVAYNRTNYFLDKDTQRGTAYDAMTLFEKELNQKLKLGKLGLHVVFIPVSRDELLTGLLEGRGDVAIAALTITPERLKIVDFTDPVYTNGSEFVVTGPGAPKITTLDDLSGREVYVRKSSSFYQSLQDLNGRFKKEGKKEVIIKAVPENLESEDLLEMANAGLIKITIQDKPIAEFWKNIFPNIVLHPEAALRTNVDYGWAIRKNSPKLKEELNSFVKKNAKGTMIGNMLFQKYLKNVKYVKSATSEAEMKKFQDLVAFFRKYGEKYSVDYLLMVAQGYQESRLNQTVKSKVGAIGIMQVMPPTGKELNVGDISQIEPNVHAGIKYMRFMMDQYYKNDPMDDLNKMLMTFASYNAGPNRVKNLRKEAEQKGFNPNIWFGNVERIAAERVGQETVTYVSNIYKYYIAYKLVQEETAEREKTKKELKTK